MDKAFIFEDYNANVIVKVIKSHLELFFYSSFNDCETSSNVHILKPKINYKNETLIFPKGLTLCDVFYEQKGKLISSTLATLLFLEENGIIYGDLKLSNIIFYENDFYLIDFDHIIFYKLPNMDQFQSQTYNFDNEKEYYKKSSFEKNDEESRHSHFTDHKRNLIKAFAILIFFLCTNEKTRLMVEKWFQTKNYKFIKSFFSSSIWKKSIKNENEHWISYIEALLNVYSFKEFFVYLSIIDSSSGITPCTNALTSFVIPLTVAPLKSKKMLFFHQTHSYQHYNFTENEDKLSEVELQGWFCYKPLYNETIFFITVEFYRCYQSSIYFHYNLDKTFDSLFFAACLKFCHMLLNVHVNYSAIVTHNDQIIMKELIEMVENKIYNYLHFKIPSFFTNGMTECKYSLPDHTNTPKECRLD